MNPHRGSSAAAPAERSPSLSCMLRQESSCYGTVDYLSSESATESSRANEKTLNRHRMDESWRNAICEWAYQVVDHFDIRRDIVAIAMNYIDRCMAVAAATESKESKGSDSKFSSLLRCSYSYQLLSMTCLYLAIKLHEYKRHLVIHDSKSTMDAILRLGSSKFSAAQMEEMELAILTVLEWRVHPPIPLRFVHEMVDEYCVHDEPGLREGEISHSSNGSAIIPAYPVDGEDHVTVFDAHVCTPVIISPIRPRRSKREIIELSTYLVELAALDYAFVVHRASDVAAAALQMASGSYDPTNPCRSRLQRLYEEQQEPPEAVVDKRRVHTVTPIHDDCIASPSKRQKQSA